VALPGTDRQVGPEDQVPAVRAGAFSQLLRDLVRAPAPDAGLEGWAGALHPGAVIGRFELVREVGRGGFGVVYEARDRELGRTVAFKALQLGGRPEVGEERLLREAEAAARLSHPNIVTLHDVGRSPHGPYLVLELLRGRTLAQRLDAGPVPVGEAVRVATEVARGLAHAHREGVVHRDLTPGNVFLCDDGRVKILDFGMAHAFGRRKLDGGTPAYMAPEQGRGAPEDERTDVFALGVILYRMLSGALPFAASGARSASGSRPPPALDVPDQPALGALVARMLQRDPVARPRDGGEVLAVLEPLERELGRTPAGGGREPAVRRRRHRPWRLAAAVALGVALAAGATGLVLRQQAARRAAAAPPSIAVLPFTDLSPQKDQEYFSDGLSEEILNALAHVDGLLVAGRTSSFAFKGRSEDLRAIGEKLNVGAVLEGSVRKSGNRVRITAQVIKLPDGFHVWSETFDRELTDIFAVQDEIARAVAHALEVRLLPGKAVAARERRPANPEAYNHYLLAKQLYSRFGAGDMERATAEYRKALAIDPQMAPAWAGLAITLYNSMDEGGTPALRDESLAAAQKAVALDPALAEGYSARGVTRGTFQHDWTGAQADLETALRLSPGDATVLRRYAILQATLGRGEVALGHARHATEVDPLFAANWTALADAGLMTGRYVEAQRAIERALELAPDYAGLKGMLAQALLMGGKAQEALALARQITKEQQRLAIVSGAEQVLGHAREAQQALDELVARHAEDAPHTIAVVYAFRGERDRALQWLERAVARDDKTLLSLKQDPWFASLRDEPRYKALLRRANFPEE
jgi:eukaryotic-like serine/threonine-protein kinase